MHAAAFGRDSLQAHGAGPAPAQFTFCASTEDAVEDLCVGAGAWTTHRTLEALGEISDLGWDRAGEGAAETL